MARSTRAEPATSAAPTTPSRPRIAIATTNPAARTASTPRWWPATPTTTSPPTTAAAPVHISSPRIRRPRTSSARRSGAPSNWVTSATLKTTGPWTAPQRITASNATSAIDGPQIPTARGVATSDSAALAVP